MIDDLTIAAKVEGLGDYPTEVMSPLGLVPGRPAMWGAPRAHGSLFVTYCPATSLVTCRISVPRWVGDQVVNFPLVPIKAVDDLRPSDVASHVIAALGATIPCGADPEKYFPIRGAAVTRVSYAVDISVSDPLQIISGCAGLPRRNPATFTSWGMPPETIQWRSRSLGAKFYAKGLELQHQVKNDGDTRQLNGLVAAAKRIVRFEVSFRSVRSLRDLFGLSDARLPNLALMCGPQVDRYALGREATRLRLYDSYSISESKSYASIVRRVATVLREAQAQLESGDLDRLGRRRTLTADRIWDLGAAFFWLAGFGPGDLSSWTGRSRATLDELCPFGGRA